MESRLAAACYSAGGGNDPDRRRPFVTGRWRNGGVPLLDHVSLRPAPRATGSRGMTMRQLWPFPCDPVDPADLYAELPCAGMRPAVRLNMIASIDGATALAGLSGGLGGPADQALFAVLRSKSDIVLVAAGTVRAEHYGPLGLPVAVVSRSCRLDWDSEFFTAATARPIVITVADAPTADRKRAADVAEVVV